MSKVYSVKETFTDYDSDDNITCEEDVEILFTVLPAGGGGDEPRYARQAEFHSVKYEVGTSLSGDPREEKMNRDTIEVWAENWLSEHNEYAVKEAIETDIDDRYQRYEKY